MTAPHTAATHTAAPQSATPDAAAPDSAAPQSAAPHTAAPQSATPDAAAPQGATPDAATPDAATPDAATRDGAAREPARSRAAVAADPPRSAARPLPVVSVAPMMDWTDRHCRSLHRLLAPSVRVYTEMVTTGAILHGPRARLLDFDAAEHPVALQLGGSDPAALAACARIGADWGYDEINLNCGCPSPRVTVGAFGACLMAEPDLVADCCAAMADAVQGRVPVTVKTRIGIDHHDSFDVLARFVDTIARRAGVCRFIIHARKAWLSGLSPKQNREIPPLQYDRAVQLKAAFPQLSIHLNGGLSDVDAVAAWAGRLDGVMIGRAAYHTPWLLAELQNALLGGGAPVDRAAAVHAFHAYVVRHAAAGVPVKAMTRHAIGLFHGQPGGKLWRRHLSVEAVHPGATADVLLDALAVQQDAAADVARHGAERAAAAAA